MENNLQKVAMTEENPKWRNAIQRQEGLYARKNDLRSEFERDYTRIIHCNAYRRLKHKTQVFFSPSNDHICTRIEHVNHVGSISYTIGNYLGLNIELIKSIAVAHDLGHSPFGHKGEKILDEISKEQLGESFWHEKNGLHFVDDMELLEDNEGNRKNLNLTYAVRDGIISHCGEVDENSLKPREEVIELCDYTKPNQYKPYTWEGCVIKIADKISYIGRDIEDAIILKVLSSEDIQELNELLNMKRKEPINNTNIINELVIDLCQNSNIEQGLHFSQEKLEMMNRIKAFNYQKIYLNKRVGAPDEYFSIILHRIFNSLAQCYNGEDTGKKLVEYGKQYSKTYLEFLEWIENYWSLREKEQIKLNHKMIYDMKKEKDYKRAILDYIAGMTDNYAIESYQSLISF